MAQCGGCRYGWLQCVAKRVALGGRQSKNIMTDEMRHNKMQATKTSMFMSMAQAQHHLDHTEDTKDGSCTPGHKQSIRC